MSLLSKLLINVKLIVFGVGLLLLSACSEPPISKSVRVGFNPWPGYELIYLAKVKEFYSKQGVDVKLVELNSLGDVRRAFERGQIDIMASTMVEVLIAAENTGRPVKLIAVTDASNGSDMLLARKPINSIKELPGKSLGVEGATVDVLVAGKALASAGHSLKDVTVIAKAQDDLVADIQAGRLDAIQTYPPNSTHLLNSGNYNVLFTTADVPGEILDTLSVSEQAASERPDDIKAFLTAYYQAYEYFLANPKESAEIMGKREGITGEEFLEAVNGMQLFGPEDQHVYLRADSKGGRVLKQASQSLIDTGWLNQPVDEKAFFIQ